MVVNEEKGFHLSFPDIDMGTKKKEFIQLPPNYKNGDSFSSNIK